MKRAWIVYYDSEDDRPTIIFEEPDYSYSKTIIPIVYTELDTITNEPNGRP